MFSYKQIASQEIQENLIRLIAEKWMLVTAGTSDRFNTMTASWGGMGFLWNKPVAFVFVRPQRYTFEFVEQSDYFTLSFFNGYREALQLCGTVSGRDRDKVAESGLTPLATPCGSVAFTQADLIIECRKVYADFLKEDCFIDREIAHKTYSSQADMHKMYVAEIVAVWQAVSDK